MYAYICMDGFVSCLLVKVSCFELLDHTLCFPFGRVILFLRWDCKDVKAEGRGMSIFFRGELAI